MNIKITIFSFLPFLLLSCYENKGEQSSLDSLKGKYSVNYNNEFQDYWMNGTAEINFYSLKQNRYGQVREGGSVLLFVTEDFNVQKQVKAVYPGNQSI